MKLKELVNETIKEAMKAKDASKLMAYRSIKSAFLLLETQEGAQEPTEDDYLKAIIKMAKQRKDSIEIYEQQGRADLAATEKTELAYLEDLLPKQLNEEEIRAAVSAIITEIGAEGMKDMGKVMGAAQQKLGSTADGKLLAGIVRNLLS